jgi:hypothetical protein
MCVETQVAGQLIYLGDAYWLGCIDDKTLIEVPEEGLNRRFSVSFDFRSL